jgi:hypothetical protein
LIDPDRSLTKADPKSITILIDGLANVLCKRDPDPKRQEEDGIWLVSDVVPNAKY